MRSNWVQSLGSADYLPHRFCYLAEPGLVWTNVIADGLIAASYALIFACLLVVARRLCAEVELRRYLWVFCSFATFILACGLTHVMEVVTVWKPVYPIAAMFKVLCAAVSVPTAVAFAWKWPQLGRNLHRFFEIAHRVEEDRDRVRRDLSEKEQMIAEREATARKLATLNARLTAVMNSTTDGILKVRPDWTIAYGNRTAVGTLPGFVEGKSLWECFPGLVSTHAERNLREAMELREVREYENYYRKSDVWYRVQASPMEGGISIFFSDISNEKKLQEQLEKERWLREKRVQALSHMAGGLAHEISNPLAIIHGRASDLHELASQDGVVSIEAVAKASESILRTSDRAIRILRGLRGFGRDATKDLMEYASLHEIVDGCVELQQARLERHQVDLRVTLPDDLPKILCREVQIGQIITNLLNNAFDEIVQTKCEERWIQLSVKKAERSLYIEVTDSGLGIAEDVRDHLMEPFFTTKDVALGMGVGLSLSKAIAEDHGGTLVLLADTGATCFRLTLPTEAPPLADPGGPETLLPMGTPVEYKR